MDPINESELAVVLGGIAHMLGICDCRSDEQNGTADSESEPAVAEDVVVAEAESVDKPLPDRVWQLARAKHLTDKTAYMRETLAEYEAELSDLQRGLAEQEVEWEEGSYYQRPGNAVWLCVEHRSSFSDKALLTRWCNACDVAHEKVFYNTTPAVEGYKKVS